MHINIRNCTSHVIHIYPLLKFQKYKQDILYSKIPKGYQMNTMCLKRRWYWEKEIYSKSDMNGPFICMATNSVG